MQTDVAGNGPRLPDLLCACGQALRELPVSMICFQQQIRICMQIHVAGNGPRLPDLLCACGQVLRELPVSMIRGAERSVRQRCARLCFQEFHEYQARVPKRRTACLAHAHIRWCPNPKPLPGGAQLVQKNSMKESSRTPALSLKVGRLVYQSALQG